MKNYAETDQYKAYLQTFEYIFAEEYFVNQELIDLSEEYQLLIDHYRHQYKTNPNFGYDIQCQRLTLIDHQGLNLFETKLVFGRPFYKLIQHSNGDTYLVCGNDLLDFSLFNITKKIESHFVSALLIDDDTMEEGNNEFWYITDWIYNPINNLIAINGQNGMNCATITICDFAQPENFPLSFKNLSAELRHILSETDPDFDGTCTAFEWADNHLQLSINEVSKHITLNNRQLEDLFHFL